MPLTPDFKAAHDKLGVRPLAEGDWEAYSIWVLAVFRERGLTPREITEIEARTPQGWQEELRSQAPKYFAAFDQGKIIALSSISLNPRYPGTREVMLEVTDGYGNRGIGTRLYTMMKEYAALEHPDDHVIARILPGNKSSRRAAEKAGFVYTGYSEQGTMVSLPYMIFGVAAPTRAFTLDALRPKGHA